MTTLYTENFEFVVENNLVKSYYILKVDENSVATFVFHSTILITPFKKKVGIKSLIDKKRQSAE
jgi:hypothetical protein